MSDVALTPTVDPDAWRMSEGSFSYPYLKKCCEGDRKVPRTHAHSLRCAVAVCICLYLSRSPCIVVYCVLCGVVNQMTLTILNATLTKLTSLPPLATHRRVAELQLMALLHMMKQFIALGPVYDKAFLAKASTTLTTFYFWPQPFGGLARDLLVMIQKETVAPGAALRYAGGCGCTLSITHN